MVSVAYGGWCVNKQIAPELDIRHGKIIPRIPEMFGANPFFKKIEEFPILPFIKIFVDVECIRFAPAACHIDKYRSIKVPFFVIYKVYSLC